MARSARWAPADAPPERDTIRVDTEGLSGTFQPLDRGHDVEDLGGEGSHSGGAVVDARDSKSVPREPLRPCGMTLARSDHPTTAVQVEDDGGGGNADRQRQIEPEDVPVGTPELDVGTGLDLVSGGLPTGVVTLPSPLRLVAGSTHRGGPWLKGGGSGSIRESAVLYGGNPSDE